MFKRLLIANRGEIACRIMRTAHRMGIETVAVFSDADRYLPHAQQAGQSIHIGASPAVESYLDIAKIIAAAQASGADAIHPGYGFLSENTALAKACHANNFTFIGPDIDAIESMGSKSTAKKIMQEAGVALLPGYHGDNQDDSTLRDAADQCGYPVLIKASAGGGGKGMRIVQTADAFNRQLASAKREALAAFADDKVIIEKYLQRPRHIEVQVFADNHGNVVHLYDRDCSIQRRYQKVIEEAPAPHLHEQQRRDLHASAVRAAQAINYRGAGTIEFICDRNGQCYFMEMNTRLQVEHPVSEMITGIDLVEWQLRVADGQPLPLGQADIHVSGHAMEARVYAEDTEKGFLPATGTLEHLAFPHIAEDLRIDSGIETGATIGIHYDPMLAKLIVHAQDRHTAARKLAGALLQTHLLGIKNNIDFLTRIVMHEDFKHGHYDTGFIDQHTDALLNRSAQTRETLLIIAALYLHTGSAASIDKVDSPHQHSWPWGIDDNWRMNTHAVSTHTLGIDNRQYRIHVSQDTALKSTSYCITLNNQNTQIDDLQYRGERLSLRIAGKKITAKILHHVHRLAVFSSIGHGEVTLPDLSVNPDCEAEANTTLLTPMPGKIVAILATPGAPIKKGQPLLIVEAMKMEHTLTATRDGVVSQIYCQKGDTVAAEAALIEIDPEEIHE